MLAHLTTPPKPAVDFNLPLLGYECAPSTAPRGLAAQVAMMRYSCEAVVPPDVLQAMFQSGRAH
eukprot:1721381-Amphidinium_carterae.2